MKKNLHSIEVGYQVEFKGDTPKLMEQVHGNRVLSLNGSPLKLEEADAVHTLVSEFPLSVFTADCIPLLFFTPDPRGPIAAAHCGWRGALSQIAKRVVDRCARGDLEVMFGPCILSCCFEVKEDFLLRFENEGQNTTPHLERRGEKKYFDLVNYVIQTQLNGVKIHRDFLCCTKCSSPPLPSYRRDGKTDPRIRSWIINHA